MSENAFIISGPKSSYSVPEESVGQYFVRCLRKRNKDDPISIDAETHRVQTCQELLEKTNQTIQLFKKMGLKKDDVITILSGNIIGYNVPILAALLMGVVTNPVNPEYTAGELRHALNISKPKVVLCSPHTLENVKTLQKEFDCLEYIWLLGPADENAGSGSASYFENLLTEFSVDENGLSSEQFDICNTGALIMLSSGTTGLSKGVLLTHENVLNSFPCIIDSNYCGLSAGDTMIAQLPFFHIFGLLTHISSLWIPLRTIVVGRFKPDLFLNTIEQYKVNKVPLVPSLALFLAKHPSVLDYDLSSIEDIICGAAALGKGVEEEVIKRIKNVKFRHVYGTTETTGGCTFLANHPEKSSSVGLLVPGMKATVRDLTTGKTVGPREPGELCFTGPCIIKQYIGISNDRSIFDEDGFYRSGDVGYYDEDEFFYIVGRIKELIKYKGFQVSPVELENLLMLHPAVQDCGVIGVPDERAGQLPLAFIVPRIEVAVTEQELVEYVAERISSSKRLYGGVRFVKEIPKNATGKILRRKLEELFNELSVIKALVR